MTDFPEFAGSRGDRDRAELLIDNYLIREGLKPRVFQDRMAVSMRIPPLDEAVLIARNPDLISHDAEIQSKAWSKFEASPESEPYRLFKLKRGGKQCRSITAR
jgi:hypothetical protein